MGRERERNAPRRLGDLLPGLLKEWGPRRRQESAELSEAWARAAGADVARRSRIVGLARDTLTVAVESAPLRQEIETFRKPQILARMRAEFPRKNIADMKCVLRALET